jgi:hypothetical protein
MSGVNFTRESAELIGDTVRRVQGFTPGSIPADGQITERQRPMLCGILLDDLEPATHPRLGATAARMRCYAINPAEAPDYPTPRKPALSSRIEWVVNRDTVATAEAGTFAVIGWTSLAEWHWVVLGCGPAANCSGDQEWTWDGSDWQPPTLPGCGDGCVSLPPDWTPTLPGATDTTSCIDEALA